MSEQQFKELNGSEQGELAQPNSLVSRRTLLASLGMAGVTLAAGSILGNSSGFIEKAEAAGVTVFTVKNMADLKAISPAGLSANDVYYIAGYYAAGDGGGGEFYWDASSTSADNGGSVIIPTGYAGTGRWKRA
ncbi:hypothetical protein [Paenibacillus eucommiae]|uniref:Uncharacterized protein n=1 Tax=Paenibacillus eucommiae TaxID=1355755 RepID=A0ABS4J199_9BACL|nr:hypothetical protein [Paenibacillus eucommiae]MBP1993604.1 hypothetical protein [Paenibacillus eucommiae]